MKFKGWEWLIVVGIALLFGAPTVASMTLPHDSIIVRILVGGQVIVMAAAMGVALVFVVRVNRQAQASRDEQEPKKG